MKKVSPKFELKLELVSLDNSVVKLKIPIISDENKNLIKNIALDIKIKFKDHEELCTPSLTFK